VRMHWMWSVLLASAMFCATGAAHAVEDGSGTENLQPRSDRLDIFGAGMCHQCEWRPRAKVMAAQEQCGVSADGKARVGVFECGRSPQCDPVCNFISCEGQ